MRQGCFRSAGCGSSGFDRRANLLKSYFSGFRPAEMHFFRRKNRFLLREASRTSDSAFPASSSFYHLLTPKGGTKSVRQAKSSGNGRRMHLKRYSASSRPRFRRRIRRPFFFPLFRNAERLCASRNNDFDSFYSVLAGRRPAGSHCEDGENRRPYFTAERIFRKKTHVRPGVPAALLRISIKSRKSDGKNR